MEQSLEFQNLEQQPVQVVSDNWSLELLLNRAYNRLISRFSHIMVAVVLSILIYLGATVATVFACVAVFFVYVLTQQILLASFLGAIVAIVLVLGFFYIQVWTQLTFVQVVIQDEQKSVGEVFKSMRSLVVEYSIVLCWQGVFLAGLFWTGFFSFWIVYIFWMIWSLFTTFVYLDFRPKRLGSLWLSKQFVEKRFWRVVLYQFFVFGAYLLYIGVLSTLQNSSISLIGTIFYYLLGIFIFCFQYELYLLLRSKEEPIRSPVWIGLSSIGWVFLSILLIGGSIMVVTYFPEFVQQLQETSSQFSLPKNPLDDLMIK
ncbi:MAG: hypothetical protein WCO06_06150 [Candidatus Roizmanbacteria bacterium]